MLFLIHNQSFASGFELKKLLKNEKISLNNDMLNIEQHGKAILSRGGKLKSMEQSIFTNMTFLLPPFIT